MKNSRRRKFSVTSSLQYRFLAMSFIYSFVIVLFFALVVFGPDVAKMSDQTISLEMRSAAASRILTKQSWAWLAVFLLIILLGLHSFREFHKVAGPLYRFRWAFGQLERGNVVYPLRIRKKDYLREDQKALNKMLSSLVRRFRNMGRATEEVFKSFDELEEALNAGEKESKVQRALFHTHRECLEKLSKEIKYYRLEEVEENLSDSVKDSFEREGRFIEEKDYGKSQFETGL